MWATHSVKGNSFCTTIKKMAWSAIIYHIWRERNSRLHENVFWPSSVIISTIVDDIRYKCASFAKVQDNARNQSFCMNWGITYDIFN